MRRLPVLVVPLPQVLFMIAPALHKLWMMILPLQSQATK
jgi:hypothetical protein